MTMMIRRSELLLKNINPKDFKVSKNAGWLMLGITAAATLAIGIGSLIALHNDDIDGYDEPGDEEYDGDDVPFPVEYAIKLTADALKEGMDSKSDKDKFITLHSMMTSINPVAVVYDDDYNVNDVTNGYAKALVDEYENLTPAERPDWLLDKEDDIILVHLVEQRHNLLLKK